MRQLPYICDINIMFNLLNYEEGMKKTTWLKVAGALLLGHWVSNFIYGSDNKREEQPERLTATPVDENEGEIESQKVELDKTSFLQGAHCGYRRGYIDSAREVAGRFGIPEEQINTIEAARIVNRYAIPKQ